MNPDSSPTPYLQVSDVLARLDWRPIAGLVNDFPGSATEPTPVTYNDLLTNVNLIAIIQSACGELESAVLRSEMYQVSDLQALNGVSQQYLFTIISDIVAYGCYTRRMGPAPSEMVINNYNRAMKALEDLSNGTRIFSFQQTAQAGLPVTYQFNPYDLAVNQNLVSAKWERSFGRRNDIRRFW